jgi:hypothetical protein
MIYHTEPRRACIDAGFCHVCRARITQVDGTRPPGPLFLFPTDYQVYILYISTELLENKGFRDVPQDVGLIDPASRWPSPWAQEAGNHPPRPHNTPAPDNHAPDAPRAPGPLILNQRPQARRPAPGSVRADLLGHKARQFSKPRPRFSSRGYRSCIQCQSGRSGLSVAVVRSVGDGRGRPIKTQIIGQRDPSPSAIRPESLEQLVRYL